MENLATLSFLSSMAPNHFQNFSRLSHSVKSAMYSPKHAMATSAVHACSAYSHTSMLVVNDATSDAVRVILRHKRRENRALIVCIVALLAMFVMGIIKAIKS